MCLFFLGGGGGGGGKRGHGLFQIILKRDGNVETKELEIHRPLINNAICNKPKIK